MYILKKIVEKPYDTAYSTQEYFATFENAKKHLLNLMSQDNEEENDESVKKMITQLLNPKGLINLDMIYYSLDTQDGHIYARYSFDENTTILTYKLHTIEIGVEYVDYLFN